VVFFNIVVLIGNVSITIFFVESVMTHRVTVSLIVLTIERLIFLGIFVGFSIGWFVTIQERSKVILHSIVSSTVVVSMFLVVVIEVVTFEVVVRFTSNRSLGGSSRNVACLRGARRDIACLLLFTMSVLTPVTITTVAKLFSLKPLLQPFKIFLRDVAIRSAVVSFETVSAIVITAALMMITFMVIAITSPIRKREGYQMQE